jgi:RHS repeat-associated protein
VNKSGSADQVISHPQGGGAIKGLGESFSPDLHTGTGNLTVPIAVPPGRNKLQPDLSLVYSSGHGNGVFGLGWAVSIPGVARDTTKGVPLYIDEIDPFLLSGAEQLVPTKPSSDGAMLYRPRTEGIFARIKHYFSSLDDYWEVRSRNGLKSLYGHPGSRATDSAVVRDPDNTLKVFSWSLTETSDPFGNRIEYIYERDLSPEDGPHHGDQIYLKTIRYADYGPKDAPQYLVTVDFVYDARPDSFSNYRAGFEIRTARRCKQIEVSTHAETTQLVRVYRLTYQDEVQPSAALASGVSLLRRVEIRGMDGGTEESLPPLEFSYTAFDPTTKVYQSLSANRNAIPERSLAHPDFELADLFGRGLPDVVQIGDENRYWRNLGAGRFDLPRSFQGLPAMIHLGDRGAQLADCDGDGHVDLAVSERGLNGYFRLTVLPSDEMRPFVSNRAAPPFPLNDPEMRLLDLNGDGITDALRTGAQFELFYFDRVLGWNQTELRARGDFDRFPDVYFGDPRVKLADMTGDGLQDIVFMNNERIDYWPYLGNGRWGKRITMAGRLEFPDASFYGGIGVDPKRMLLGDVDGDGVADLVYVESGRITIWLNQSGNAWSDPIVVQGTPPVANIDAVRLADILGEGTAGILWTYDERAFPDSTYKFLDLTGGTKPYLLKERNNNAGARTLIEYATSTRFYLEDELQPSTRWATRLPFPVPVVARVEMIDELSGGKLTTEYRYHQGYWDGDDREFRGFGMVEQFDTETFSVYNAAGLHGQQSFNSVEAVHFSPPTLTRTWFHQGQVEDGRGIWTEPDISPTVWDGDSGWFSSAQRTELGAIARTASQTADPFRLRHALRSLRGSVLRTELYGLDGSPNSDKPYTVTESLYDAREIEANDPDVENRLRIFFPFQIATRTTQWERGSDPMTQCSFTIGYDDYGLPQSQLAIAVLRGRNPLGNLEAAGELYLSTYSRTEYARRDDDQQFIVDRAARNTSYEVLNDGRQNIFAMRDAVAGGSAQLRLIGHARNYYDGDAFVGLPPGSIGEFGALVRSESLTFTDDFLKATFDQADVLSVSPLPCYLNAASPVKWTAEYPAEFQALLPPLAGFVHYGDGDIPGSPGGYFVITQRHSYDFHDPSQTARGLPLITRDPLGADTQIAYDSFALLPVQATDPVGLITQAQYDYRVLQARQITDPNGNVSEFRFSPAGLLTSQFVRGKNGEGDGANPSVRMEYDLLAFANRGQPISARTIRRVHHDSEADVPAAERDATIESVEYSDGFGRLLQKRAQAEDTLFGDPIFGNGILTADQSAPIAPANGHTRQAGDPVNVVVSGWQVYDNKGRVVEKYEPFFAQGWDFSAPADSQLGQKAVMFYDPRGQVIRTLNPDGSEQLVVFGVPIDVTDPSNYTPTAWEAYTYDANDNAGRTHGNVASGYRSHWNTPASIVVDSLGRTITAIARNGTDPLKDWFTTQSKYDIQGNLLTITDALGRVAFRYVFDLAKRRWRMDSIDAGRRDTVPDALGNPIEGRDSKGALTLQGYDVLNRPTRLWARDSLSGPVTLRQTLAYGDGGSPNQSTVDRDAARSKNLLGQLAAHYDEAGLTTVTSVDFKGNILEKARRVIADGPILDVFSNAVANNWQVTPFQVDWQPAAGQALADVEAALLESSAYQTSVTYDALNRIKQMQFPQDVEGKRRTLLPSYNPAGGLEKVFLDDTLYVERIAYDAKGQRSLVSYGNGLMTRYAYDPQTFRLKRLRSERYTQPDSATYAPAGNVLQDLGYDCDLVGNILAIRDRTPGSGILNNPSSDSAGDPVLAQLLVSGDALERRFAYDPIYRLLSATGRECDVLPDLPPWLDVPRCTDITKTRAYTENYTYDPMGSMLKLQHQNQTGGYVRDFTGESSTNRLQSMQIGQTTFAYAFDVNGNMTSENTERHFEWGHADQMKVFRTQTDGSEPSVYAQYLYDSSGQRVKKLVRNQGGQIEVTHYIDGAFEHHRWGGALSGENNHLHIMDDKQRIALVRVGSAQPGDTAPLVQFQLADHLGSSNVVVDSTGALINREEFLPYGETCFGSFAKKRYRFTGVERDEESGLSYHVARYYCVSLSRWLTCDPVGHSGGTNLYRYSHDSPLGSVDALGTEPQSPPGADDLGNIAPYNKQPSAGRDSSGARTTEHEHTIPKGKLKAVTHSRDTGKSDYTDSHYRKDTTVRIERDTALNKTHANRGGVSADNPGTALLKSKAQTSRPINYRQEVFLESLENAQRAARETNSCVASTKFTEAALSQDGNLFASQRVEGSGRIVRGLGYSIADDPNTFEFDLARGKSNVSTRVQSSPQAPSELTMFKKMMSPESYAKYLERAGYVGFSYELATANSPTEAMEATTNFTGAVVGAHVGGGAGAAVATIFLGPEAAPAGQAAGSTVGGFIGSQATKIVKETDWKDTLKKGAFVGLMVLACLL